MKNRFSLKRLLPYGLLICFIFLVPFGTRAAESTILKFIPAILATLSGKTNPPPPPPPPSSGHESIKNWQGTATCLQCHTKEAKEVFSSVHYQWLGQTPYMTSGPDVQGKLNIAVNSYCINTTGNWLGCGSCHVGLGKKPEVQENQAQLLNIDCLICHQDKYKRKNVNGSYVPDTANMTISIVEAARTVHKPSRASCLQCHAKGGGGDNFKRGDMALAHTATRDKNFDVHMATTGANLDCQSCHQTKNHLMAGKGSDLRPTDLDEEMNCASCHKGKDSLKGHDDEKNIGNHVARVACQTCHIGTYARNASDTAASEKTEVHRSWLEPHLTGSGAIHPTATLAGNLTPKYKWWDGTSTNYNLFDDAVIDQITGRVPTSRPSGAIDNSDSKLYPFKYKTALQPLATHENQLIALDTSVYFSSGDEVWATISGLENMGYSPASNFEWVETDTYQLITHEVTPSSAALECLDCHDSTSRMDLQGELGYQLKGAERSVCIQCHRYEPAEKPGYEWIHKVHVKEKKYDCSWCHTFTRPERGLKL